MSVPPSPESMWPSPACRHDRRDRQVPLERLCTPVPASHPQRGWWLNFSKSTASENTSPLCWRAYEDKVIGGGREHGEDPAGGRAGARFELPGTDGRSSVRARGERVRAAVLSRCNTPVCVLKQCAPTAIAGDISRLLDATMRRHIAQDLDSIRDSSTRKPPVPLLADVTSRSRRPTKRRGFAWAPSAR